MPVAPPPTRNQVAASPTTSLVWVSAAKAAEATELTTRTLSPSALSSAPSRDSDPTLSTSAAALPSG